jgi:hypothetical protein
MYRDFIFLLFTGILLCGACSGNNGHNKELEAELRLLKKCCKGMSRLFIYFNSHFTSIKSGSTTIA